MYSTLTPFGVIRMSYTVKGRPDLVSSLLYKHPSITQIHCVIFVTEPFVPRKGEGVRHHVCQHWALVRQRGRDKQAGRHTFWHRPHLVRCYTVFASGLFPLSLPQYSLYWSDRKFSVTWNCKLVCVWLWLLHQKLIFSSLAKCRTCIRKWLPFQQSFWCIK